MDAREYGKTEYIKTKAHEWMSENGITTIRDYDREWYEKGGLNAFPEEERRAMAFSINMRLKEIYKANKKAATI